MKNTDSQFATSDFMRRFGTTFFAVVSLLGCLSAAAEEIRFNDDVRPILSRHCIACHGPDEEDRQADLRLDTFDGATADLGGYAALAPGKPADSELLNRILTDDEDLRMPPADHAGPLKPSEVETLRQWILQGGKYQQHWAFIVPKRPTLPETFQGNASAAIDHFIDEKLDQNGLKRNAKANSHALVRRLSLDLTGLPPQAHTGKAEVAVDRYLQDPTAHHFGQLADALMATPAFAEHWASMWLDLARYADTVGYSGDEKRDIWPWRDWLIHSIAENKSYRDLSIEMLAGDMLPDATNQQRLATGFHRNTLSNNEGGTNDEEFRTIAVKDRLSTTLNAWMGLTVRCAECHSHKYDPISQTEYYQLLDFFNQTSDSDRRDERPKLAVTPMRDPEIVAALNAQRERIKQQLKSEPQVWTIRRPVEMSSEAGTTFKQEDDDSILATGPIPDVETYKFTFEVPSNEVVSAIRLEAMPHLANDGKVGRFGDGGFILSQIRLVRHVGDDEVPVKFADAENDFHSNQLHARTAIKEQVPSKQKGQGWSVRHPITGYKDRREAIFELAEPLTSSNAPTRFTVLLRFDSPWIRLNMGCMRFATCSVENAVKKYANGELDPLRRQLAQLDKQANEQIRVPILSELPSDQRRKTFVNLRGNYQSLGDRVEAAFPTAFASTSEAFRRDRLGLAQWLFAEDNPLTSRVAVNRYWARLMGTGLVETEEDFGTQGARPTHPELLDFLAVNFRNGGWNERKLLRTIVMSGAYQQSPLATEAALRVDPRNKLLSRGPRVRLSAETVRDQALAVSGLLSRKMYGPPVYPPSPIKRVVNAFTGGMTWVDSKGEDRYRRAIYTFLKRSSPHPLFETFDMASRDVCNMRRLRTNTPLQSFMTLNDEVFVEAAEAMASRMLAHSGEPRDAIAFGLKEALFVETADQHAVDSLEQLFENCVEQYSQNPKDADALLKEKTQQPIQQAAMTIVANVILNLDRFLNN